jgi:membrane protein
VLMLRTFSNHVLSWAACFCGALAGGFAASAAWKGCDLYFSYSASVSAYGALSSIPAFLLWIFVAWSCMLFGAQVAAKTQTAMSGACQRRTAG